MTATTSIATRQPRSIPASGGDLRYLEIEYGNPGQPPRLRPAGQGGGPAARDAIGAVVGVRRHEVFFTSGATESNNLALLGMAPTASNTIESTSSARGLSIVPSWSPWRSCRGAGSK